MPLLIISLAVIIIIFAAFIEVKEYYYGAGIVGDIGGALLLLGIIISFKKDIPTALDVYRGKTTLQITYQNSIPVDTIVVIKNK